MKDTAVAPPVTRRVCFVASETSVAKGFDLPQGLFSAQNLSIPSFRGEASLTGGGKLKGCR